MACCSNIATANRACSLLYDCLKNHSGGTWLLPVNVCPDVPLTFHLANVPFRFVDIDPQTLCIDINKSMQLLMDHNTMYVGMVYVRTYGYLFDTTDLFASLKVLSPDFYIIDDRCLCLPDFNPVFYGADMVLFSTGHCKQIDLGEGGFACYIDKTEYKIDLGLYYDGTDEELAYKEAYKSKMPLKYIPKGWLKMDTFMNSHDYSNRILEIIPKRDQRRKKLNSIYANGLPSSVQLPLKYQEWRFNIMIPPHRKHLILQTLFENGLFASNHYHSANKLFDTRSFPVSDNLYNQVVNLFNDEYYTEEKAVRTCDIINKVLRYN